MYFSKFPHFLYDFLHKDDDENTKTSLVLDVTRNVRFKKDLLSNVTQYDEYDIVDGETPEIIAEKFYGTPHYHWIIMLANDLYDYRNDFPIPETVLQKYIKTYYNPTLHVDLKSYKIIPVSDITADNEYSYMYDPNEYHHSVIIFTPYARSMTSSTSWKATPIFSPNFRAGGTRFSGPPDIRIPNSEARAINEPVLSESTFR